MKISIIIPVYNEEILIKRCLDALINQDYPKDDYEIIVVNDGSTDDTLLVAQAKQKKADEKGVSVNVINLEMNRGRAIARETGAKSAKYENLLFVDSRCIADSEILNNLEKINYQPVVGSAVIDFNRSIFDRFNFLFRIKLYRQYSGEDFEPIYITPENYDKIPKGTTVFFCDKQLFLSSQLEFKGRTASDDTKLLWNIVKKKDLLKHPDVKVFYQSRTTFKDTIKHTFNRGPKFIDYYLNPAKKYFWIFIFLPAFAAAAVVVSATFFNFRIFYWLGFIVVIWTMVSIWLAKKVKDFFIAAALLPVFALSFEGGIYFGLVAKLFKWLNNK